MARKRRLDPGGFAYGELLGPARGQQHRDAPLSPRGRAVWRALLFTLIAALVAAITAVVALDS